MAQTNNSYIGTSGGTNNTYIGESAETNTTNIGNEVTNSNTVNVGTAFNDAAATGTNAINIGTAGTKTSIATMGKITSDQTNAQIDATGDAALLTSGYIRNMRDSVAGNHIDIKALRVGIDTIPVGNSSRNGYNNSPLSVKTGKVYYGDNTVAGNELVKKSEMPGNIVADLNTIPVVGGTSSAKTLVNSPITTGTIYYPSTAANPTTNIGAYATTDDGKTKTSTTRIGNNARYTWTHIGEKANSNIFYIGDSATTNITRIGHEATQKSDIYLGGYRTKTTGIGKTSSMDIGYNAGISQTRIGYESGKNTVTIGYNVYTQNTIGIGDWFYGAGADAASSMIISIGTKVTSANKDAIKNNQINIGTKDLTTTKIEGRILGTANVLTFTANGTIDTSYEEVTGTIVTLINTSGEGITVSDITVPAGKAVMAVYSGNKNSGKWYKIEM